MYITISLTTHFYDEVLWQVRALRDRAGKDGESTFGRTGKSSTIEIRAYLSNSSQPPITLGSWYRCKIRPSSCSLSRSFRLTPLLILCCAYAPWLAQ